MKIFLRGLLLSILLGSVSVAHAYNNEYDVYWMDNPAPQKQTFKLRFGSRNITTNVEHRGDPGNGDVYMIGENKLWKGSSRYNMSDMTLTFINPQGTKSMTFYGESVDRTGHNGWKGFVMYLNSDGSVITHHAWIK